MSKRVFLGGTCNGSTWRNRMMIYLHANGLDWFNPVVEDWTPEDQENELLEREKCDVVLYVITPLMAGVYSIAEVVDDSNKRPEKTVLVVMWDDGCLSFNRGQRISLEAVCKLVRDNGVTVFDTLENAADHIAKM